MKKRIRVLGNQLIGGSYHFRPKPPIELEIDTTPQQVGAVEPKWRPEQRFIDWATGPIKTGDEFNDWVARVRYDEFEPTNWEEIRRLFLEELNGRTEPDNDGD